MPILQQFSLPDSLDDLNVPEGTESGFFIAFLASEDPATRNPWCPDVVAALPVLKKTFSAESTPVVAFVEVGQKPEWRDPNNVFRIKWNINSVPTLARYEKVGGKMQEVGRLVEGEILDDVRLQKLGAS
ncbi:hypothetical protein WHR41_04464 [Cladosporium halotolerans]|uniref:Thioredoxin domain-containing protein n=1 Tax=Cladosporium halotolerans TaxID=1052096 RepID=A0AB34KQT2_9PEZI